MFTPRTDNSVHLLSKPDWRIELLARDTFNASTGYRARPIGAPTLENHSIRQGKARCRVQKVPLALKLLCNRPTSGKKRLRRVKVVGCNHVIAKEPFTQRGVSPWLPVQAAVPTETRAYSQDCGLLSTTTSTKCPVFLFGIVGWVRGQQGLPFSSGDGDAAPVVLRRWRCRRRPASP